MSAKSISDRSAPHHGMGRPRKCLSDFRRNLRIQSGSPFSEEISSTTASDSPFFGTKTDCEGSCQPKRYPLSSSLRCSSCVMAMRSVAPTRFAASSRESTQALGSHRPRPAPPVYLRGPPKVDPAGRNWRSCLAPLDRDAHKADVLCHVPVVVLDVPDDAQIGEHDSRMMQQLLQ